MKPRKAMFSILVLGLVLGQTACLKTRAQIKGGETQDDSAETETPKAASNSARAASNDLEEIKHELTRVSGKIEEVEHTQSTHNYGELKEYAARLDSRIAELEKNQLLVMSELKAIKDKETAAVAKEAAAPAGDLLVAANQLLSEKKFDEAADKYRAALAKNPKGKEAADAHFGLGEAEYGLKNFKKAIVQYSKVQEASSKSAKIPMSLYKIGLAFQHLNMPKESKGFFSEVIERFPKSAEAKKARAKAKE